MEDNQEVIVDLGVDGKLAILAEPIGGPVLVSDKTIAGAPE